MEAKDTEIYSKLAPLYDILMGDVDYESWADFIDEIMQTHHPEPIDVLEIACGTGSVLVSLAELECYKLTGTDLSPEMIEMAKKKAVDFDVTVDFEAKSFANLDYENRFDCVYSVFDSVNYLHTSEEMLQLFDNVANALKPGGIFIFDFSTPKNSIQSVEFLNEAEGERGNFRFYRTSRYHPHTKQHFNEFEIDERDPDTGKIIHTYKETHVQRAYTLHEMLSILEQTSYHQLAKYDGFDLIQATDNSARVTMVLQWQKTQ